MTTIKNKIKILCHFKILQSLGLNPNHLKAIIHPISFIPFTHVLFQVSEEEKDAIVVRCLAFYPMVTRLVLCLNLTFEDLEMAEQKFKYVLNELSET